MYSKDEIAVISKYKDEYKEQTNKSLRSHVLRTKILVDMFNYWDAEGVLPDNDDECLMRVKVSTLSS